MKSREFGSLILFSVLQTVYSLQRYGAQVQASSSPRFYNLADKAEASYTGGVSEGNLAISEEYNKLCRDAASRRFRTFNGTCNHRRNLGAAFTPIARILPPAYQDGLNLPRQFGIDGLPLPSARSVSFHLHPNRDIYSDWTILVTAWGQWVDHDLVSTPVATRANTTIKCCTARPLDPDCFPIPLPKNEYVFPGNCLEFVRSLAATNSRGVTLKPRQQLNTVTAFLDGSNIYGSTEAVAASVREPGGYLLRTKDSFFLPEAPTSGCIKRNGTGDYCFLAGDVRVNQHPYLGSLHTIWLREHNRIAKQLRVLKPGVSNEEIFQLARRIVIARIQVITYNGWLPLVLGEDADRWNLRSTSGRSTYNQCLDPRIFSSFSAAAFRFGHSTIPSYFPIGNKLVLLRHLFNSPGEVHSNLENVLAGMTGITSARPRHIQTADHNFVHDISRFLFLNNGTGKSMDLVTINIQRGRDHGLQPYVKWRKYCGLRPLTGFNDTEALGPFVGELRRVYRSLEDIDLFTGMTHEPIDTGIAGPTVRCLVAEQFLRIKNGDRFFFDNNEKNSRFTDAQLTALRKTTLSEVICLNSHLKRLPLDPFRFYSKTNQLLPCSRHRQDSLNLALFV